MAEVKFFKLILNKIDLNAFLLEHNLIISDRKIEELGLTCRNANCSEPNRGFTARSRRRNISRLKKAELEAEEQDGDFIDSLQCKCCRTYLSPRTNSFLTYQDNLGRSNCKLAPEKALQLIWHWVSKRSLLGSVETIDVSPKTIVDWFNFCRTVCATSNATAHQRLMGNGNGRGENNETPGVVVQIDECLLRGKRLYNRGRILRGDANIPREDIEEWNELNNETGQVMDPVRNYGRRISGPWIFGLAECFKNENGSYTTKEVRLFHVERRNAATLIPIIRAHVQPGSMIWSDEWAAYNRIGADENGFRHETVNHSQRFIGNTGTHTQNIERVWSSLKLHILKNMRGTTPALLPSHLGEFMWRSRSSKLIWDSLIRFIDEAAEQYPITW